ncbi:ParB/RepB/Spo0J family partition protein [Rickettsiales endosymbiont of Paramecium tredecaurelia]|uniref:ParB/RepB/Spo0J family partition protein n=1 Tax=Candidatus Sarmatiella mevalonica TaxID=2770581 RepID=UPI001923577F|nr:ParB/RepB/Spo0J family partition protein [Candidatus Sarmatiella mevalonica]MBL3284622.1 ParB/RepB/Spo0J family partition protein [Candidatus Sarmatiella mevalonica]
MGKKIMLGRGLESLLRDRAPEIERESTKNQEEGGVVQLEIMSISPGLYQPRKKFHVEQIQELADSILNVGLIQPIVVYPVENKQYKIIAGERRWRAAQIAGLTRIDAIVKNVENAEILKISLIENIQREELTKIEEAEGLMKLMQEFRYTQEELSQILGKSRSYIANILRLNHLSREVKEMLENNQISMGHARCLINHPYEIDIAKYIIENDLNVRETEALVKTWPNVNRNKQVNQYDTSTINYDPRTNFKHRSSGSLDKIEGLDVQQDENLVMLEENLCQMFRTMVKIRHNSITNRGAIVICYRDMEHLDQILDKLK